MKGNESPEGSLSQSDAVINSGLSSTEFRLRKCPLVEGRDRWRAFDNTEWNVDGSVTSFNVFKKNGKSEIGKSIRLEIRGKKYDGKISELPFYKKNYVKGDK